MPALDATLTPWPELAARHPCDALLLGNGASRAVWKPFGYFSLFEQAQRAGRKKGLAVSDQALFKSLATELFEPVLSALNTTVRTNAALAINSTAPLNRYYSIKEALIHAVRTVHLPWPLMPKATLATLNQALRGYRSVYTSNYDLLLPWAVQHAPVASPNCSTNKAISTCDAPAAKAPGCCTCMAACTCSSCPTAPPASAALKVPNCSMGLP